jgi:hypothetical protein
MVTVLTKTVTASSFCLRHVAKRDFSLPILGEQPARPYDVEDPAHVSLQVGRDVVLPSLVRATPPSTSGR